MKENILKGFRNITLMKEKILKGFGNITDEHVQSNLIAHVELYLLVCIR